jgi:hypothetical protein
LKCPTDGEEMIRTIRAVHIRSMLGLSVLLEIELEYHCEKCRYIQRFSVGHAFTVEAP